MNQQFEVANDPINIDGEPANPAGEPLDTKQSSKFPKLIIFLASVVLISLIGTVVYLVSQNQALKSQINQVPEAPQVSDAKICEYNGQTYKIGESFISTDGCNSCSCTETGEVACTIMACGDDAGQVQADPTMGWQLFANEYFSLKYPRVMTVTEGEGDGQNGLTKYVEFKYYPENSEENTEIVGGYTFNVYRHYDSNLNSMQRINDARSTAVANCDGDKDSISSIKQVKFGENEGYQYTVENCTPMINTLTFIDSNGVIFEIATSSSGDNKQEYKKTIDQVLSTFKFNQ